MTAPVNGNGQSSYDCQWAFDVIKTIVEGARWSVEGVVGFCLPATLKTTIQTKFQEIQSTVASKTPQGVATFASGVKRDVQCLFQKPVDLDLGMQDVRDLVDRMESPEGEGTQTLKDSLTKAVDNAHKLAQTSSIEYRRLAQRVVLVAFGLMFFSACDFSRQ